MKASRIMSLAGLVTILGIGLVGFAPGATADSGLGADGPSYQVDPNGTTMVETGEARLCAETGMVSETCAGLGDSLVMLHNPTGGYTRAAVYGTVCEEDPQTNGQEVCSRVVVDHLTYPDNPWAHDPIVSVTDCYSRDDDWSNSPWYCDRWGS